MAEESTLHYWINTAIATIAVLVSGVSLYYANSANNLAEEQAAQDREDIGVDAQYTLTCPWSISQGHFGELGLCWKVELWNKSIHPSEIQTLGVSYSPTNDPLKHFIVDAIILSLVITRTDKSPVEKKPPIKHTQIDIPGRNHARMIIQVKLPYSPNITDTIS
jgi:hypothetical protein